MALPAIAAAKPAYGAFKAVEAQRSVLCSPLQPLHGVAKPANVVFALYVRLDAEHGIHVQRHVNCSARLALSWLRPPLPADLQAWSGGPPLHTV
jgi:hypothetical protein